MNMTLIFVLSSSLFGQAPASGSTASQIEVPAERKAALEAVLNDAKSYEIVLEGNGSSRLELLPRSILNWSSAERNDENGGVFVWMKDGRPEAIGAIWSLYRKATDQVVWRHGLQSLSEQPLTARFESQTIWAPRKPGVEFKPAGNAEDPSDDPQRRLVQMRNLAREFTVEIDEQSGVTSQLRLLTQPILRYQPTAGVAKDGAIFALNAGTDPDALLVLEARESGGRLRWEYAFGRLHFVALRAFLDGKEVWSVSRDQENRKHVFGSEPGRDKIYYSVVRPR